MVHNSGHVPTGQSLIWYSQKSPFLTFEGVTRPGPTLLRTAPSKRFLFFHQGAWFFQRMPLYLGYYLRKGLCQAVYDKLDCDCQDEDCHQLWNDF